MLVVSWIYLIASILFSPGAFILNDSSFAAAAEPPVIQKKTQTPAKVSKLTYEAGIGMSDTYNFGTNNYENFTELELGINYFFLDWLDWHNSLFDRIISNIANTYGWDSSLIGYLQIESLGFGSFAGLGFRIISAGTVVPTLEAGVVHRWVGIQMGFGVHEILNSISNASFLNDTVYFINISRGWKP